MTLCCWPWLWPWSCVWLCALSWCCGGVVCPFKTSRVHQAGPLPPQGWRLNSKTCVHRPLPVPTESTKKRIGTKTGAVCHAVARSSVERALRCVRVVQLVCCVGESVCATSHLLYVLPCRVAAGYATPAVRPPEVNPKCICLPSVEKRCIEGHEKTKLTVFF